MFHALRMLAALTLVGLCALPALRTEIAELRASLQEARALNRTTLLALVNERLAKKSSPSGWRTPSSS